jgi:predicted GNAT family acetyltransferase
MTAGADQLRIEKRPERNRYELSVAGKLAAFVDYRLSPGRVDLVHTEVLPAYEGQGLASRAASFALDDARREGLQVEASCAFVAGYIERHPEYRDLLAPR